MQSPFPAIERQLRDVSLRLNVAVVAVGENEGVEALDTHAPLGKDRHAAQFHMGGCIAYARTKTKNAHLLDKGDHFIRTDFA